MAVFLLLLFTKSVCEETRKGILQLLFIDCWELNKHRPLPVVPANFLTSRQETLERAGPSKAWRAGGGSGSAGSGTLAATEGARPGPALT
ncbi:hypothetical protein ROHU_016705 [Labeo rohita]|uniref:Uncharacterized protein n=1 Tax=Labeo rohita TaxID=84645 RepID=A0A498NJ72_LABRO|nr:hypothetical protein ROHU_016705 [Labeo rohita]